MMFKRNKKNTRTEAVNLISYFDETSPIAERYRTIRTNIQYSVGGENEIKTIVVTSPTQGDGKSTTSANLAVVFAQTGQKTLLVDGDMRRSSVHKTFNCSNDIGLTNYLTGNATCEEVVKETTIQNLDIITGGIKAPNPAELLTSVKVDQLIAELKEKYDIIIFDMPAIIAVTDAQIMATHVDGTILVATEGVTRKDLMVRSKELLDRVNAKIIGAVYKTAEQSREESYYYYYTSAD